MPKDKKPPRPKPIQSAIEKWLSTLNLNTAGIENLKEEACAASLIESAPKRYTVYEPMLLLPSGSFSADIWTKQLNEQSEESKDSLWRYILEYVGTFGKVKLSHLAINEGIPLKNDDKQEDNILRSPSGMKLLYGDFGPGKSSSQDSISSLSHNPTSENFQEALWVSTKQNGIIQTWAPNWTMFSRGNIKEKARLMEFPSSPRGKEPNLVVDLYAGIGYFTFSYASMGFKVLCWEINPWSVEGLRRGAALNRWSVKVIQGDELERPTEELIAGQESIVVFLEDNQKAPGRVQRLRDNLTHLEGFSGQISHVNCGYLPSSEPTWKASWDMCKNTSSESWLHLHENVGVHDVEKRKMEIEGMFASWAEAGAQSPAPKVSHVEYVKTFAPGVWHCVFDIHICR